MATNSVYRGIYDTVTLYPKSIPPTVQLVRQKIQAMEAQNRDDAFFVVDLGQIFQKLHTWHRLLPRVRPFYAMKCNSDPEVCRFLARAGVGFDCASQVEMEQILSLGVHPSRIVYANPCKACTHLRYAQERNVDLMTFDDVHELVKIDNYFPDARLLLRIQSSKEHKAKHDFNKKFGCDPDDAPKLLKTARAMGLNVVGVSFHVGSLPEEVDCFASTIREAKGVFTAGNDAGFNMQVLDIGGGFPGVDEVSMTFEKVAETVNTALDKHFPASLGIQIIAEPGRYLVTSAFTVAVNIIAKRVLYFKSGDLNYNMSDERVLYFKSETSPQKKKSASYLSLVSKDSDYVDEESDEGADLDSSVDDVDDDKEDMKNTVCMYYINDGIYGAFNNVFTDHAVIYPELPATPRSSETFTSVVWGPTCDGLDCVLHECQLPDLDVGQWLYFHDMGAYTVSLACAFNGINRPQLFYVCADTYWNEVFSSPEEIALTKLSMASEISTNGKSLSAQSSATISGKGLFEKIGASSCFATKGYRKG
ncbi:ornithine decarboxylase [Elysia marginata]|uniref:Ornithine decarboxylase n=1 Tax=Elysia marginata TaxID=1093978 RepID=A0AAV4J7G9_9GAST|nr:ornithine decarboxylase [Elysia marginata]